MASVDKLSSKAQSILEVEEQVSNLMQQVRARVNSVYDKFLSDNSELPALPPYQLLVKQYELHYSTSVRLAECVDELLRIKMRVTLMTRHLSEIKESVSATSSSEYHFLTNFKANLDRYISELENYKFDIIDLIRNANSKIRILETVAFYREDSV